MNETYWIAEILSVAPEENDLIIRLEWVGRIDTETPVVQLKLKECNISPENMALLTANRFGEVELFFQQENEQKYLEIAFISTEYIVLRLKYTDCERQETSYNLVELINKAMYRTKSYKD